YSVSVRSDTLLSRAWRARLIGAVDRNPASRIRRSEARTDGVQRAVALANESSSHSVFWRLVQRNAAHHRVAYAGNQSSGFKTRSAGPPIPKPFFHPLAGWRAE